MNNQKSNTHRLASPKSRADDTRLNLSEGKKRKWRWWHIAAIAGATFFFMLLLVWSSLGWQPAFYRAALLIDAAESARAGDEFERLALDWVNQTKRVGPWSVEFSASQVNGWAACDLVEKFPTSLPDSILAPRIDFRPDELELALQWRWSAFRGVATVRADLFATGNEGELALRLIGAKTGLLPLPLRVIGDRIADGLRGADFSVRWDEMRGDPVLLIMPPDNFRHVDRATITIRSIDIQQGKVLISGDTKVH